MNIIGCYMDACDSDIEAFCDCTSPETFSCEKHLLKHCKSRRESHNISSIFLDPAEGTKEAILSFLAEQKTESISVKIKLIASFYQTFQNYKNALEKTLKEVNSDSAKTSDYLEKIMQVQKISRLEKDPVLSLLILQPDEAAEKAKAIFTKNKIVESFYEMINQINKSINSFNGKKYKVIQKEAPFTLESTENMKCGKDKLNLQLDLKCLKEEIRIDPNNGEAYNEIGVIFHNDKRYEEALKYYSDAIKINPNEAIYHRNKGNALFWLDKGEEAWECYKEAIRIDPNYDDVYNCMGDVLFDETRYQEAIKYYSEAIRINPSIAYYYTDKGDSFEKLGQSEEAIKFYEEAIRIDPQNDNPHQKIGKIYHKAGKYEKAVKYYSDAIRINPNNGIYFTNKGNALKMLGKIKEAEECFSKAIKLKKA